MRALKLGHKHAILTTQAQSANLNWNVKPVGRYLALPVARPETRSQTLGTRAKATVEVGALAPVKVALDIPAKVALDIPAKVALDPLPPDQAKGALDHHIPLDLEPARVVAQDIPTKVVPDLLTPQDLGPDIHHR